MQNLSLNQEYTDQLESTVPESLAKLVPIYSIYENVKKIIASRTGQIDYPTGLTELDKILWGLHKKELICIGARTSVGKSLLSLQIAKNLVMCGQTVLFFSLEMSKESIVERLLSNMCEIDNVKLREGKGWEEVQAKEEPFKEWLNDVKLVIDDYNGYRFSSILEVIQAVKPDFVIVDYVQMISTKGFKDKLSALEDFVKEIQRLGVDLDYGSILVSQINRTGVGDRPFMHQLKHAGILEEHSSVVLLLHHDLAKQPPQYIIYVEKNRNGKVGEVLVDFQPQYFRVKDFETNFPMLPRKDLE